MFDLIICFKLVEESAGSIVHQIFIGNLPFTVDEDALRSAVDEKLGGTVSYKSMRLQTDKKTGLFIVDIIDTYYSFLKFISMLLFNRKITRIRLFSLR